MESGAQRMPEKATERWIPEYDLLRVIATLLMIVGHSTYYRIVTPYGGCDYTPLTLPGMSVVYRINGHMTSLIYLFHMPLYVALSGALFRVKKSLGGGYASSRSLITDKAKRLLIPYITVTLFYSVPMKWVSGYYSASEHVFKDIVIGQILDQGNNHLWFLLALFLIFIVGYSIEKNIHADSRFVLTGLFAASFVSVKVPILILQQVLEYAFWFYVGYRFEDKREALRLRMDKGPGLFLWSVIVFLSSAILYKLIPETPNACGVIKRLVSYLTACAGCLSVYVFSYSASKAGLHEKMPMKTVRNHSLGLYLYSDTWNYVILSVATKRFASTLFCTNIGSALLCAGRIALTFSLALTVSMLLKKINVKYIC